MKIDYLLPMSQSMRFWLIRFGIPMKTILEPWSTIYECYEDSDCEDRESLSINTYDTLERSFDEAILNRAAALSRLLETTKELATVTCNNNGFYE